VWAAIPPVLLATRFAHGAELAQARALLARMRGRAGPGSRPAGSET
jgi:hypothetical protein